MNSRIEKLIVYLLPLVVLITFIVMNPQLDIKNLNRALALSSIMLLGITFIIGPLGRFSRYANRLKAHRKYLGIAGFALALVHSVISFVIFYNIDLVYMLSLSNPEALQVYSALIAFIIFLLMTLTSNQHSIRLLGARNWKILQTSGYVAMALAMLHFFLANTKAHGFRIDRTYAFAAFVFGVIVIAARISVLILTRMERTASRKK